VLFESYPPHFERIQAGNRTKKSRNICDPLVFVQIGNSESRRAAADVGTRAALRQHDGRRQSPAADGRGRVRGQLQFGARLARVPERGGQGHRAGDDAAARRAQDQAAPPHRRRRRPAAEQRDRRQHDGSASLSRSQHSLCALSHSLVACG